jgi:hypothetical protein
MGVGVDIVGMYSYRSVCTENLNVKASGIFFANAEV